MLTMQKRNAPLNKFPAWKYILIIVLIILGIIYSLPNIFSESPRYRDNNERRQAYF